MTLRPFNDYVVIEIDPPLAQTEWGFEIPPSSQKPTYSGIVTAVGSRVKYVKPGDRILHNKFCGVDFDNGKKLLKFFSEDDVMVIL
jgi:co-chaperonin GroES (HSP10)